MWIARLIPFLQSAPVHPAPRRRLRQWLSCPAGKLLLDRERELLDNALPHIFGHYILQVGRLGGVDLLARSRIPRRFVADMDDGPGVPDDILPAPEKPGPKKGKGASDSQNKTAAEGEHPQPSRCTDHPGFYAVPHALPVASDSIDAVVLPHLLEFSPHMWETMQEAERVLVADGHLLILAFNAWSLVGLWRFLCPRDEAACLCVPRGAARFSGLGRIRNAIATLGLQEVSMERYFFRPPLGNRHLMERLGFLDTMGPRFWPFFSGAYFIVAKKQVTALTPVRKRQQHQGCSLIPELSS